jgi:hypothetical protein
MFPSNGNGSAAESVEEAPAEIVDVPALLPEVSEAAPLAVSLPVPVAAPIRQMEAAVPSVVPSRRPRFLTKRAGIAVAGIALLALAVALQAVVRQDDALDRFWRPVFSSHSPILLCVGNVAGGQRPRPVAEIPSGLSLADFHSSASQTMLISDAMTLSRLSGLLQAKGKGFRVVSQSEATFADMQNSPAVLIGLANNDWTERLVGKLHFWVEHRAPGRIGLRDRDHPERQDWFVDFTAPYLAITRDYALVIRVLDPKTEQMVVTAAGISAFGTLAAGEFLTSPQEFKKIEAVAPAAWPKQNFEIVLSTEVIRGKPGHPEILATHFW